MKQLALLLLFLVLPTAMFGETFRCSVCNQEVSKLYALHDLAGGKKMICANCYTKVPRCGVCRMPLRKEAFKQLSDGRLLCADDFAAGVFTQQDADEVVRETRRELERVFYRFNMTFPETNITVTLVSADRIYELAHARYNPLNPELDGFTQPTVYDSRGKEMTESDILTKHKPYARVEYQVYLVSGLPRPRLTAVCAHELAHVWHFNNLKLDRSYALEGKTREAFCELVAYQLMDAMNQSYEKAVIHANLYTFGQADLLIEVEKNYGFNRILQWMKHGVDAHISSEDLDRIRVVDGEDAVAAAPNPAFAPAFTYKPIKIPDTLLLKGIMGSGSKRLALINNQTFSLAESAKVKIGATNVLVQVTEIRDTSVLIRTNNSKDTQEIFLQK